MNDTTPIRNAVSAGGVVYRIEAGQVQVALISVGEALRWQLPKGTVDEGETNAQTALREVREETGLTAELEDEIDKIDYWFYGTHHEQRVRFHKYVYFYLMRYLSGDVSRHDHEVNEARWFEIDQAIEILAFDTEREMVKKAQRMLAEQT